MAFPHRLPLSCTATDATARADLDDEPDQVEPGPYPHKCQHGGAQTRTNVQIFRPRKLILEYHKHDRRDDGARGREQQRCESEDRDGQLSEENPTGFVLPPRVLGEAQRREEDAEEGQDRADQETGKHPRAGQLDQVEDVDDLGGQGDGGARQQLVEDDLDRVEPIQRFGRRAIRDSLPDISLAEVPQPDLVEIVQSDGLGD